MSTGPAADGLGWWLGYLCQLAKTYGWAEKYILFDLPGKRGWAYYSWAIEHDPDYQVERTGSGYIAQEVESRLQKPSKSRGTKKRK